MDIRDILRTRKRDYEVTFSTPEGKRVLRDLANFCCAERTAYDPNPQTTAFALGRQDVYLRIKRYLHLDFEDIYNLVKGKNDE